MQNNQDFLQCKHLMSIVDGGMQYKQYNGLWRWWNVLRMAMKGGSDAVTWRDNLANKGPGFAQDGVRWGVFSVSPFPPMLSVGPSKNITHIQVLVTSLTSLQPHS